MADFEIPREYADKLEYVDNDDWRTDKELLDSLNKHVPVTSEQNIWAFWHSGITTMPAWCQRNVADWARICGPDWQVRVVDNVPESPNYALKLLSAKHLPECFVQRTMDGPYVGQHSADFVRGAAILEHGGIWFDVGTILTMDVNRMCWNELSDPNSPYEVAAILLSDQFVFNYWVAAKKNNPFIQRWHEVMLHIYEGQTNCEGLSGHPLLSYVGSDIKIDPQALAFRFDWKVGLPVLIDYLIQVAAWNRVAILEDTETGFSGPEYWTNRVLLLDFATETGQPLLLTGTLGGGQRLLDLLSLRVDDDEDSPDYELAKKVVWTTLADSSFYKIPHTTALTHQQQLGTLLSEKRNAKKDCEPGTFAELLRYGAVNFKQKRRGPNICKVTKPAFTLRKGLLEP